MNSIMQILFSMQEFQQVYGGQNIERIFRNDSTEDPTRSFPVQMAKLSDGLMSGRYSEQQSEECPESLVIFDGNPVMELL